MAVSSSSEITQGSGHIIHTNHDLRVPGRAIFPQVGSHDPNKKGNKCHRNFLPLRQNNAPVYLTTKFSNNNYIV